MRLLSLALAAALCAPAFAQVKTADQARAAVRAELRDPASAQFRNVRARSGGGFCGEVNSKNGFGGMTGFAIFSVDASSEVIWLHEHKYPEYDAWEAFIRTQMVSPEETRTPRLNAAQRSLDFWEQQIAPCLSSETQAALRSSIARRRADIDKAR